MADYEVEFKARVDHEAIRPRLEQFEAEPLETVHQSDTYYDAPVKDFAKTDEALRLRRERGSGSPIARITYKGPRVDEESKTRQEHETTVGDAATAHAILDSVGFDPVATVEKTRERFRLDRYTISLDVVGDLGEFLEVETPADDAELAAAREGARGLLADLDVASEDTIRTSYLEMVLDTR